MRLKLSLLTLLLAVVSGMAFGQVIETEAPAPPPPPPPPPPQVQHEIFKVVEEMPRFPGCEEISSLAEKKACAQKELLTYVYTNLVYPPAAKENQEEGLAVVSFVVKKNGRLDNIRVVRDPGAGMGEAAAAVIHKMNTENFIWVPGKQRGRAVEVQFNLPVRFKIPAEEKIPEEEEEVQIDQSWTANSPPRAVGSLEEEEVVDAPPPPPVMETIEEAPPVPIEIPDEAFAPPSPPAEEIFKVVEEMPRFRSAVCEEKGDIKARKACAQDALLTFINDNLQYPTTAKEHSVEGVVVVQFTVERDGSLSNTKVLRDLGAGCGAEATRIIQLMSMPGAWVPGKQRGQAVRVQFNLPIKFKL